DREQAQHRASLHLISWAEMTARNWLIDGAPGAATSVEVLSGACERLLAAGAPIARAETYVRTLHPQFAGRAFAWTRGEGCRVVELQHDADLRAASDPVQRVFATGLTQRYREPAPNAGMTDVVALPLVFTTRDVHAIAFATDRADGFTDADVARLESIAAPLSRMAEILALRRTAENVV